MTARIKESTLKATLEADDLMSAALIGPSIGKGGSRPEKTSGVALDRVKLTGSINMHRQKAAEAKEKASEKRVALKKEIQDMIDKDSDVGSSATRLADDIDNAFKRAKAHIEDTDERLAEMLPEIEAATTDDRIKGLRDEISIAAKRLGGYSVREWNNKERQVRQWIDKGKRDSATATAKPVSSVGAADPFYTSMIAVKTTFKGSHNTGSLFEAKAGVRASAVMPKADTDPVGAIVALPMTKTARKTISSHLLNGNWCIFPLADEAKVKKYKKILGKAFDAAMFSQLPVPASLEWAQKVFQTQFVGMQQHFAHVGVPHFALMEARVVLEGSETVFGIPIDDCPGDDIRGKRNWLMQSSSTDVSAVVEKSGWCITHDQTAAVVIPSGCICIIVSEAETTVMRWSMSSDEACTNRAKFTIINLLRSFKELANPSTGYQAFANYLDAD